MLKQITKSFSKSFSTNYTKGLGLGVGILTISMGSLYFCFPFIQTKINKILLVSGKNTSDNLIEDVIIQKKLEAKLVSLLKMKLYKKL